MILIKVYFLRLPASPVSKTVHIAPKPSSNYVPVFLRFPSVERDTLNEVQISKVLKSA